TVLERDEHVRPDATLESLSTLKPVFQEMGEKFGFNAVIHQRYPEIERINYVHHAGNSSGIVDGASALLIGSRAFGEAAGLKPRARFRSFATVGSEPAIMLTGPSAATEKALKLGGLSLADVDLFELNEAFASMVLYYMDALSAPHDKINVNGGAIAMGHPLGATGGMILGTLLDELERTGLGIGVVAMCMGAGMGIATVIERV
ncbi:MAG: acetyl-CoA C-acyltransferase, partial [Deltaproteobacteria bacterium]|nr:acetyl-CoA C-acyltransferase [Deltaproteobacteria bacterium]